MHRIIVIEYTYMSEQECQWLKRKVYENTHPGDRDSKEVERACRWMLDRLLKGLVALRRFSCSRQDLSSDCSVNSVTPVNKYG